MNKSDLVNQLLQSVDDQREELERALRGAGGRPAGETAVSLNRDLEALLRREANVSE